MMNNNQYTSLEFSKKLKENGCRLDSDVFHTPEYNPDWETIFILRNKNNYQFSKREIDE